MQISLLKIHLRSDEEIILVKNTPHFLRRATRRCCRRAWSFRLWFEFFIFRAVLEDIKIAIKVLINFANASQILKSVAVVRGRPNSSKLAIEKFIVSFLADLVSPIDPYAPIRV